MKRKIKVLWVEDDQKFAPSLLFRIGKEIDFLSIEYEYLTNGVHYEITVRDWKPDLILLDHNLDDVKINGANLVIYTKFLSDKIPIIFYSSEMGPEIISLVRHADELYTCRREDLAQEYVRVLQEKFT